MADETSSRRALHDPQADGSPDPSPEPSAVPRQQPPVPPADEAEPQPEDGSAPTAVDQEPDGESEQDTSPRSRNLLVRGASAAGLRTGRMVHGTGRQIRRATAAEGAGESGLAKLIELHALNSFGDMLITVALASTIFFSVPTGEARGRVAAYLLITMAPFALLAPVIGPLLDRLPHGRRAAMAMSMLARAVLAWTMAGTVATGGIALYPEALGVLVASKAYGVVRSVVVPRLLPPQLSLVKANSRVTLAGLMATMVAAGVGGVLHLIGPGWPLRGAFLVFVIGTVMAFHLPHKVDSAKGELRADLHADEHHPHHPHHLPHLYKEPQPPPGKASLRTVGPSVILALRAVSALRWLVGFMVMFLAFLLRDDPVGGVPATVSLGIIAAAAGIGNALGSVFGSWLRTRGSEATVTAMLLLATVAASAAALWYSLLTVALLALAAGVAASLGKLALDALIQRDVPEAVRTSAFARSETVLQLSWVVGGALGILLPLDGALGLSVAAGVVGLVLLWTVRSLFKVGLRGPAARPRVA
ncbi:MFS transporter [Kitasatospora atroaurantiaca]|uniref:Putative MFS family arabinose efflux permease n=2 Tax=Kitasatospora atroaurantiaca TaxID=285545 RepID=A0A561ETT2_9ACTN|nr:putative MFS family arabinose efflux permease [Kitasatospora atroaurantiaca]